MSHFVVEKGYEPRISFDWQDNPDDSAGDSKVSFEAREFVRKLNHGWELAKRRLATTQAQQKAQADKYRQEVNFGVGGDVYLSLKGLKQERPSAKLSDKNAGPFRIIRKICHAYELQLPASYNIHPIFAPEKLRRAHKPGYLPLTGQHMDHLPSVRIAGEEEWEVERILDSRLHYRKLQYKIWWNFHDRGDEKWYPARNVRNAPLKLQEFHQQYPKKAGPPKRLQHWIRAALEDEEVLDHPDDGKPAEKGV